MKMNKIKTLHYIKLVYRGIVFLAALFAYFTFGLTVDKVGTAAIAVWLLFLIEIIFKFFPSPLESRGCQKQFKKNYIPKGADIWLPYAGKGVLLTLVLWSVLNGIIAVLYYTKIIDAGMMVLISLAYAVSDMVCVLFFCPFQKWLLRTRCCVTCRIYNWDYAMICTPLIFINNIYAQIAVIAAFLLTARWEWTAFFRRERFYTETNAALSCNGCTEKNCRKR